MRARMSSSTIPAVSGGLHPKRRKSALASIDATRKMYQSERRMDATVFELGEDGDILVGHGGGDLCGSALSKRDDTTYDPSNTIQAW
jgi:hypothetical protein